MCEIARRLKAQPVVQYFAAWCALRSRWRLMWASLAVRPTGRVQRVIIAAV